MDQTALAILGVIAIMYVALILLYGIPSIIIWWKLVAKAGRPGWSQIIPYYNFYVMALVAKRRQLGIWYLVLGATGLVIDFVGRLAGNITDSTAVALISSFVSLGLSVGLLIIWVFVVIEFARRYDAGVEKWLAFILLPIVGVFFVDSVKYTDGAPAPVATTPGTVPAFQPQQTPIPPVNTPPSDQAPPTDK